MRMPLPMLGAHESISGGLFTCIERGEAAGCDALQIFTKSNHQWAGKEYAEEDLRQLFDHQELAQLPIVASHSSYLINIGSPDDDLWRKSLNALEDEVRRCDLLRIPNLVFHPGSHTGSGEEAGIDRIAAGINEVLRRRPDSSTTLCLEATAGQGTNLGYRFEHLGEIIARIDADSRVGVCLDSCHIFAAGYPLSSVDGYADTMSQFERVIGFPRLRLWHLNDSVGGLGSRKDRHAHIGEGEIGIEGFIHIVRDHRMASVPMVLETPKEEDLAEDAANLLLLRSLAAD
jgi:deoxyribonuclease-4